MVIARDLTNGQSPGELVAALRSAERALAERLTPETLTSLPQIESWREAYRSAGFKPSEFRPSVEALARRVLKGDQLPLITTLVDLGTLLSIRHLPAAASRLAVLEQYSPLLVRRAGHLTAALAGFALLLLAGSLWRRKRVAWLLTLVVLIVSAASHLIKGLDYEEALLSLGLAVWLWFLRPQFHARSDRPSIEQGIRVLAIAFVFTLLYGVVGFYLLDRHYSVNFGLWNAVRQTTLMFTEFYDPGLVPITRFGRYFADSIYVVGAITIGYAILMLVRPVLIRELPP